MTKGHDEEEIPTLSVCMIVKDEEENLPRLLASIKGLADEVIVVDTGSKDGTVEIAKRFGARVYHFPWCDDFSAARNESLKHATKDFILWLDGDDELKRQSTRRSARICGSIPGTGVYLHTYVEGQSQALQLRIFPNHREIRFEGRIHEQVINSLEAKGIPTYTCNAPSSTTGTRRPGALVEKLQRNRKILEEELNEHPGDMNTPFSSRGPSWVSATLNRPSLISTRSSNSAKRDPSRGLGRYMALLSRQGVDPCLPGKGRRGDVGPFVREVRCSRSLCYSLSFGQAPFREKGVQRGLRRASPSQGRNF